MKRAKALRIIILIAVVIIGARLFWIQVVQHSYWEERAEEQHTLRDTIVAKRGEIYMLDGENPVPVVMNETVWTVIVDPMLADEQEIKNVVDKYASDKKIAKWEDVFANKEARYYVVAKDVERKAAEGISEEAPKGLILQQNTKRVYPEGELGASLLGFVNAEGEGQYGVEGSLNDELAGKDGILKTVADVNSVALSIGNDNVRVPAEDGKNLVLTIDRKLQSDMEKVLAEQLDSQGKTNGSILVMDPNNGKILAMTNLPGYSPEKFGEVKDASVYSNGILNDPYEPASVCKTFALAASIDQGKMTPESTYVNTGSVDIDGWNIRNAEQGSELLGTINMQTVFNYSLNTGSIQALRWMGGDSNQITDRGRELLYEYYHDRFGLAQPTGIELYEATGLMTKPYEGYGLTSTYANMTFGQNMLVTMIQVAAAFSSVVNGGNYYIPTVVAGEMKDGKFKEKENQGVARKTISEDTSEKMRGMLYGTRRAWRAAGVDAPGYYVGGKTGTAQVIRDGAYVLDESVATYIGFGGTEGELPEYVIMVRIWKDGTYTDGQKNALPLFNAAKVYVQDDLKIKPKE